MSSPRRCGRLGATTQHGGLGPPISAWVGRSGVGAAILGT
jgi:hypothetical protein